MPSPPSLFFIGPLRSSAPSRGRPHGADFHRGGSGQGGWYGGDGAAGHRARCVRALSQVHARGGAPARTGGAPQARRHLLAGQSWRRDRLESGPLLVFPRLRLPRRPGRGGGPLSRPSAPQSALRSRSLLHQGRPGAISFLTNVRLLRPAVVSCSPPPKMRLECCQFFYSAADSIVPQVLANRPDIIREDYMNELCILQDDVPSFPNEVRRGNFFILARNLDISIYSNLKSPGMFLLMRRQRSRLSKRT